MFRNLFRIFRKETVSDGSNSTKDAVLLLGYRFAGHCRNAETRAAGEKEFYEGLKTTLSESKVIPSQGEGHLGVPAFPLLSCNGFVTGNAIPLKVLEGQNDIVDRINTVLPSHVRVYDVIETSPDFQIIGWDGAVCSCYIPTCLLKSSAKNYIGHRIDEGTISKLHETSKQFCSLKDFGAFKIHKQTSEQDVVTKFDILPCFHQNGCEYIQLVVGFKGLTVEEVQKIVGVSLAAARNDLDLEEILESNRGIELPYFPRLMLDEVQFDTYNKSLEGNKSYRQIDWTLLQGAQNEFKRKLFLPGMVEQDTTKTFWWNEFIFRPVDLSSRQKTKVIKIDIESSTEKAKETTLEDTDEICATSCVQSEILKSDTNVKPQEEMIEDKTHKDAEKLAETSSNKPKNLKHDNNLTLQEGLKEENVNMETDKSGFGNIKKTSQENSLEDPTHSTDVTNTYSVKKLKERLGMNSVESDENDVLNNTKDPSSDVPLEFLTFVEASIRDFDAYLSAVDIDMTEGKKVQLDMREHLKSPVDMMQANPTCVDDFWSLYKMLDQIKLTSNTLLGLCKDLHLLLMNHEVNKKLKGKRLASQRKHLEVSIKDVLSKLEKCVQNIKELKQGQEEIIDGMIQVTMDDKDELDFPESSDNNVNDDNNKRPSDIAGETVPLYYDTKYMRPSNIEGITTIDQETVVSDDNRQKNDAEENKQIKKGFDDMVNKNNEEEIPLSGEFESNKEDFCLIRPLYETFDSVNNEEKDLRKHTKVKGKPKPIFGDKGSDSSKKKRRKEKSLKAIRELIKSREKTTPIYEEKSFHKDFEKPNGTKIKAISEDFELAKGTNIEIISSNAKKKKKKSLHSKSRENNKDKENVLSSSKEKSVKEHPHPEDENIKHEKEVDKGTIKGKGKPLPKLEELF